MIKHCTFLVTLSIKKLVFFRLVAFIRLIFFSKSAEWVKWFLVLKNIQSNPVILSNKGTLFIYIERLYKFQL